MSLGKIDTIDLTFICKAISMLDNVVRSKETLLHPNNPYHVSEAIRQLDIVIDSCGYTYTEEYRLILKD